MVADALGIVWLLSGFPGADTCGPPVERLITVRTRIGYRPAMQAEIHIQTVFGIGLAPIERDKAFCMAMSQCEIEQVRREYAARIGRNAVGGM